MIKIETTDNTSQSETLALTLNDNSICNFNEAHLFLASLHGMSQHVLGECQGSPLPCHGLLFCATITVNQILDVCLPFVM